MIRFPQKHIADQVADRIMKIDAHTQNNSVAAQGVRLEQAMAQPVGDVAAVDGIEDAVVGKALRL